MVVISHGTGGARDVLLYPFWIDQAVPIFLLIQVFHAYKHDMVNYPSFSKLWSRIMKPFLAIQCLMVVYYLILYLLKDEDFTESMLLLVKLQIGDKSKCNRSQVPDLHFLPKATELRLSVPI